MSVSYGAWSEYQRSNWALDGINTVNNGCSTEICSRLLIEGLADVMVVEQWV